MLLAFSGCFPPALPVVVSLCLPKDLLAWGIQSIYFWIMLESYLLYLLPPYLKPYLFITVFKSDYIVLYLSNFLLLFLSSSSLLHVQDPKTFLTALFVEVTSFLSETFARDLTLDPYSIISYNSYTYILIYLLRSLFLNNFLICDNGITAAFKSILNICFFSDVSFCLSKSNIKPVNVVKIKLQYFCIGFWSSPTTTTHSSTSSPAGRSRWRAGTNPWRSGSCLAAGSTSYELKTRNHYQPSRDTVQSKAPTFSSCT